MSADAGSRPGAPDELPAEKTQASRFGKTRSAQSTALREDYVELIADLIDQMNITRIVVAHRPALLRRAKRVVTVENRGLIELDRHGRPHSETVPLSMASLP